MNPVAMIVKTLEGEITLDAVLHRSGATIVVELEPLAGSVARSQDFHRIVRGSIERLGPT